MSQPELEARYRTALLTLPDGNGQVAEARKAEDEYRRLTSDLIRKHGGGEDVVRLYEHPFAFSGGAQANDEALNRLCASVHQAASEIAIDPPEMLARWWPDVAPSAASTLGRGGLLIRMSIGLLTQLRFVAHVVCGNQSPRDGDEFRQMLDICLGGEEVPIWWTVRIHHGAAENARRKAMMAGLAYVLAHELGHHVARGREFTSAAVDRQGPTVPGLPYSESQAVAAFASEVEADLLACRVLLAWSPQFAIAPFDLFVGAATVLAIQATLFWLEANRRSESLAWTHPFPDLRTATVADGLLRPDRLLRLDPGRLDATSNALDPRAQSLIDRLAEMTGASVFRKAALEQGLYGSGLSVLQRAMIALVYGHETRTNMADDGNRGEVKYSKGTPDGWNTAALKFKVEHHEEAWFLTGDCPRCGHPVQQDLSDRVGAAFAPRERISAINWTCACGKPHDGAPAGVSGCGAEGIVEVQGLE